MEKGDKENGRPEQMTGSHEPQRVPRPAPGKVARTSKLSPGRGLAAQRKAATARIEATPARSVREVNRDSWMDAAHRGVTAGQGGRAEIPGDVRAKMEAALGADFSPVRIHEGPHAEAVGALAYTQGTDIHFAPGQYQPDSQRGQELLGHELTHVLQQSQGRVQATTQAKGGWTSVTTQRWNRRRMRWERGRRGGREPKNHRLGLSTCNWLPPPQ
jgi:Domain of unknown function (DUF4157)